MRQAIEVRKASHAVSRIDHSNTLINRMHLYSPLFFPTHLQPGKPYPEPSVYSIGFGGLLPMKCMSETCWRRLGGVTWLSRTLVLHVNGSVLLEHLHTVWTKTASFARFFHAFPLIDLKHLVRSNQSLSILKGLCAEETESNQN